MRSFMELFDYLVGFSDQLIRDTQSQAFRRPYINDQLKLGRQLNRQIGGSIAAEKPPDIAACPAISL